LAKPVTRSSDPVILSWAELVEAHVEGPSKAEKGRETGKSL
jgi:hypothetical protein